MVGCTGPMRCAQHVHLLIDWYNKHRNTFDWYKTNMPYATAHANALPVPATDAGTGPATCVHAHLYILIGTIKYTKTFDWCIQTEKMPSICLFECEIHHMLAGH